MDIAHNKEPIAKTVETEADHVSRNQLSDGSDSDEDIVTHVVPTRHKISVQRSLNPLAEVFSPIGSTTFESILEMSNHSRSLEVSNYTDDIVSEHATDASRLVVVMTTHFGFINIMTDGLKLQMIMR